MVLAPNTSVGQRTSSVWDVTTAVTITCVTLFDVDFSNQCAYAYLMTYLNPGDDLKLWGYHYTYTRVDTLFVDLILR